MPRVLLVVALLAVLAGCGEEEPEVVDVGARVTTAEDALECADGAVAETHRFTARSGAESSDAAVRAWALRVRRHMDIPADGYQVSIEEVGTVLYTHATEGRAEIAVVAERAEADDGDRGWVVRSWARCRPTG